MSNQPVALELERILKGKKPPKRIQMFFSSSWNTLKAPACIYVDNPKWQGGAPPGGAIIGDGPMAYDPCEIAGWRVVKE